eukprot:2657999-Amphidinium_carterae.1
MLPYYVLFCCVWNPNDHARTRIVSQKLTRSMHIHFEIKSPRVLKLRGQGYVRQQAHRHRGSDGTEKRDAVYMYGIRFLVDSVGIGRRASLAFGLSTTETDGRPTLVFVRPPVPPEPRTAKPAAKSRRRQCGSYGCLVVPDS